MDIKVALVDNMNNNFFALTRYLKDFGINAYLYEIPNSPLVHFKAQADTFENVSEIEWIKKFPVNINNKNWLFFQKKKIYNEFKNYDLIISCGFSNAYLKRSGLNSDIIIPYGSDLYDIPFRNINFTFSLDFFRSILWLSQASLQKKAYKSARVITIDASTKLYYKPLKLINVYHINSSPPMVYNLKNPSINILDYIEDRQVKLLNKSDFIVFNHARQYWSSNLDRLKDFDRYLGIKRNDKVIKAFGKFLKQTKYKNSLLCLFEYGPDVEDSKILIRQLGIGQNVIWFRKMERKIIILLLKRYANLATDQFRENISDGFSGVSYEVLSTGKPLLKYFKDSQKYKDIPVVNVLTEEDILNVFIDYEKNPLKYKDIGKQAKEWFNENLGIGLAKKYVELIELLAKDKTLTQNDKIVREIFEK